MFCPGYRSCFTRPYRVSTKASGKAFFIFLEVQYLFTSSIPPQTRTFVLFLPPRYLKQMICSCNRSNAWREKKCFEMHEIFLLQIRFSPFKFLKFFLFLLDIYSWIWNSNTSTMYVIVCFQTIWIWFCLFLFAYMLKWQWIQA